MYSVAGIADFGAAKWHQAGQSQGDGKFSSGRVPHIGDGVYISGEMYMVANGTIPPIGPETIHCMCQGESMSSVLRVFACVGA